MASNSYATRLQFLEVSSLFRRFRDLVKESEPSERFLVAHAQILFGNEWEISKADDIVEIVKADPLAFFKLVSTYLADFPEQLFEPDRSRIADALGITVEDGFEYLKVTENGLWIRYLTFRADVDDLESDALRLTWTDEITTDIVPLGIYDFLRSALVCYRNRLFPGSIALAAIAFEASLKETLRRDDMLFIEEQTFQPSSGRIDAYKRDDNVRFEVRISGAEQTLSEYFTEYEPRGDVGWLGNIRFSIARNHRDENSVSGSPKLSLVPNQDEHATLLASNQLYPPTHKEAKRFKQYNSIAENHGFFRSELFSPESAEVLREVRNIVIHWDEEAIAKAKIDGFPLIEYMQDARRIQATLANLADFVSYLYERTQD